MQQQQQMQQRAVDDQQISNVPRLFQKYGVHHPTEDMLKWEARKIHAANCEYMIYIHPNRRKKFQSFKNMLETCYGMVVLPNVNGKKITALLPAAPIISGQEDLLPHRVSKAAALPLRRCHHHHHRRKNLDPKRWSEGAGKKEPQPPPPQKEQSHLLTTTTSARKRPSADSEGGDGLPDRKLPKQFAGLLV
jgi:hypothetical protein